MAFLSVNINKVATLRNSRGKDTPNLLAMTQTILDLGVKGITVHPRPDERHIKKIDIHELTPFLQKQNIEFNIEGYPTEDFLNLVTEVQPLQCTLVPDPPDTLTSNAGWDIVKNKELLKNVIGKIKSSEVRVAIFIDPTEFNEEQFAALLEVAPDRVELYTEEFADSFNTSNGKKVLEKYHDWAKKIKSEGIKINAGHDLNQQNLGLFLKEVPQVDEVSIGHAIFCEALYEGIKPTVKKYLEICETK